MGHRRGNVARAGWFLAAVLAAGMLVANVPGAAAAVVPRATCQPGDKPDTALQGQVSLPDRVMGRAAEGYFCNVRVVGQ